MDIVCLDLEGVLVPEIWIAFAEKTGIPEFKRTTRDEPDYDKLMHYRMDLLDKHGLGLNEITDVIGVSHGERINCMVESVIEASRDGDVVQMTDKVAEATDKLRDFLFANVYKNPIAKGEETKAKDMLCHLFEHFAAHPEQMPAFFYQNCEKEGVGRCVCDYISGMTDRYAIDLFRKIYMPDLWSTST